MNRTRLVLLSVGQLLVGFGAGVGFANAGVPYAAIIGWGAGIAGCGAMLVGLLARSAGR